jgi:hypothetical protein
MDMNLGKFYTGVSLSLRQDFSIKPLLFMKQALLLTDLTISEGVRQSLTLINYLTSI